MGEEKIFDNINRLLAGNGYRKINSLTELQAFLGDKSNTTLEVYDQIAELYSVLQLGPGMW